MQVGDGLTGGFAVVGEDAEAVGDAIFTGEVGSNGKDVTDKGRIGLGELIGAVDVLLGHDQNVDGRNGSDIVKSEDLVIFIGLLGGDFTGNAKQEQREDCNNAKQRCYGDSPGCFFPDIPASRYR